MNFVLLYSFFSLSLALSLPVPRYIRLPPCVHVSVHGLPHHIDVTVHKTKAKKKRRTEDHSSIATNTLEKKIGKMLFLYCYGKTSNRNYTEVMAVQHL